MITLETWLFLIHRVGAFPEQDALNIARRCFSIESIGGQTSVRHQVSVYYNMKHCHCAPCCKTNGGKRIDYNAQG